MRQYDVWVSHDGFSDNVFSGRPRVVEPTLVETVFSGGKHDVLGDLVDAVIRSRLVKFGSLVDSNLTLNFDNNTIKKKKKKKRIPKAPTMRPKRREREQNTDNVHRDRDSYPFTKQPKT